MALGTSPPLRDRNVARLDAELFDVLIVGAGINGAVSAAALAAMGAKVALVDRGDFACFTSQESSNLVWGGIKYLENWEFRLVRKLCRSRNELLRSYPANIREIRFFTPIERTAPGFTRTLPALLAGTWLYWLMGGGFTRRPRLLTRRRLRRDEPRVRADAMKGGVEYSDAFLFDNDARFVLGFVRGALEEGAVAANYVECRGSTQDDAGVWCSRLRDRVGDRSFELRSRFLVNAAGPYVDALNRSDGIATPVRHVFSKGIHIVVERIATRHHVLTFFDDDNRMFFAIPMGHRTVIGTTDTRVERPETEVTPEDRAFVLDNLNRRLALERHLSDDDIIAERCGVRPLVVEGSAEAAEGEWVSLSRKHVIAVDDARRHLSIFGGKLTDCLNVGEEVADHLAALGLGLPGRDRRWWGEPPDDDRRRFMHEATRIRLDTLAVPPHYETLSERLWRRYGMDAFEMLEAVAPRDRELAQPVSERAEYRFCEAGHAAGEEMVVTLEDFLRRRSKLALVERREALLRSTGLRRGCELLFGPDADTRHREYFGGDT